MGVRKLSFEYPYIFCNAALDGHKGDPYIYRIVIDV